VVPRAAEQRVAADEVPWHIPLMAPLRGTTSDGLRRALAAERGVGPTSGGACRSKMLSAY
jgi:hypothetical protein